VNSVNLIGNLTRDPESRETKGGTKVCTLRLAMSARAANGIPVYVDVTTFDRQAEVCAEYLRKGRSGAVSGRLGYSEWEVDGQKRSKHEVIAERVEFLSSGAPEDDVATNEPAPAQRSERGRRASGGR
jgi:single-strand DNA-binding protein